jgi:hypothetical protein
MTWKQAKAGIMMGNQCTYQGNMPSPEAVVKWTDGTLHLVAETDLGPFTPTPEQEQATNWILAPYNGDLPPR